VKVLLTGGAGFIGSHVLERLVARGDRVTVVDDLNDYYDPSLKRANLEEAKRTGAFTFVARDISAGVADLLPVDVVVHLAARANARRSLEEPEIYHRINVNGTLRVLEDMRAKGTRRIVFASSSSVYGNAPVPFREDFESPAPLAPYGATKLIGEHYLSVYAKLHGFHASALRFFTAYGPRQRPDMAFRQFGERIRKGEEIRVFGDGSMERDFTYIDDIVQGVLGAVDRDDSFEVYNLGESRTVRLSYAIELLESILGKKAAIRRLPDHPGDVRRTCACIDKARSKLAYAPTVPIEEGLRRFVAWLKNLP